MFVQALALKPTNERFDVCGLARHAGFNQSERISFPMCPVQPANLHCQGRVLGYKVP